MSSDRRYAAGRPEAFWGLTDREWTRSGLTLAEGLTLARRLLASPLVPEAVVCTPVHEAEFTALAAGRCPVTVAAEDELRRRAGFAFHRGVIAVARRPEPLGLEAFLARRPPPRRLVCAPDLTDPENLGSLFRSALALGWDAVAVGPASCDPYSRRCAKVGMGAVYARPPVHLPADPRASAALFDAAGWDRRALTLEPGADELEAWRAGPEGTASRAGALAVYLGNEFQGVAAGDRSVCRGALVVPMAEGHDSLNAAVAAAIALYRLA